MTIIDTTVRTRLLTLACTILLATAISACQGPPDASGLTQSVQAASSDPAPAPWQGGKNYAVGARVTFQGIVYVCRQAHRSQATWTPPATPALWTRPTPTQIEPWAPQTHYLVHSAVTFGGNTYECLAEHFSTTASPPTATPSLWRCASLACGGGTCQGLADGNLCDDGKACTFKDACKNHQCVGSTADPSNGTACILNCPLLPLQICEAPAGLSAVFTSDFKVQLNWQDQSARESGYEVQKLRAGKTYLPVSLPPNSTTFSDPFPEPGASFTYTVRVISTTGGPREASVSIAVALYAPPDGTACDDGDQCTSGDVFTAGMCSGVGVVCPAGNQCQQATCDSATGACGLAPKPSGTTCEDANQCTGGDTCDGNASCVGGPIRNTCDTAACPTSPGGDCGQTTIFIDATDYGSSRTMTVTSTDGFSVSGLPVSQIAKLQLQPRAPGATEPTYTVTVSPSSQTVTFSVRPSGVLEVNATTFVFGDNTSKLTLLDPQKIRPVIDWAMEDRFGNGDTIKFLPAHLSSSAGVVVQPNSWVYFLDFCSVNPFAPDPVDLYGWTIRPMGDTNPQPIQLSTSCRIQLTTSSLGKFLVTMQAHTADGRFVNALAKVIELKDILVVSIGDSYSSGEGNPDVTGIDLAIHGIFRTPENMWDYPPKHLSRRSGHIQAALMLERSDPHSAVTFISVAQSGAVIDNLIDKSQKPEYSPMTSAPQMDDIVKAICGPSGDCSNSRKIDYLLVGVGGNDIGFGDVISACGIPNTLFGVFQIGAFPECNVYISHKDNITCPPGSGPGPGPIPPGPGPGPGPGPTPPPGGPGDNPACNGPDELFCSEDLVENCPPLPQEREPWNGFGLTVRAALDKLKTMGYPRLNQKIRAKLPLAADAKILMPEYPDALVANAAGDTCDELVFPNAGCGDPRGTCLIPDGNISASEAGWAHRMVFNRLNQILNQTSSLGWTPVSGIAAEGAGHAYCSSSNSTVTYTQSWETQEDLFGTMHPNGAGQENIARHLAQAMGVTEPRFVQTPQILRTSDENPPADCSFGSAVVGAGCIGDFCDDIEIMCKPLRSGVILGSAFVKPEFSDESTATFLGCHEDGLSGCQLHQGTSCGNDGVITGVGCSGDFCDNVQLQCRPLITGSLAHCAWTPSITDETRWNVFMPGKVATAARCQGDFCDNMSYYVCDVVP